MIVRIKTRIASHIQHYLTHVTHISMQYRFSFAFSDIKKKADYFMCAATAIMTLTNKKSINSFIDTSISQKSGEGSLMAETWLELKQPFSLREKVINNISKLQLNQSQNREEILNLFRIGHGFQFENLNNQQSIKNCAWTQQINASKHEYFVFDPTSAFQQLFYNLKANWIYRKILMGNYGIGKSSNQFLANILTTYLFKFRKEGEEADKELQASILRNANLITSIMGFTKQKRQIFKDDQQLVLYIIRKFYDIPFVLYYSFPQQKQAQSLKKVGFSEKDFLLYLTKQQIQKLPQKKCQIFCQQIKRICRQNHINLSLVVDQAELYFSSFKKLQAVKSKIYRLKSQLFMQQRERKINQINTKRRKQWRKQLALDDRAQSYGVFVNRVTQVFQTFVNITLSCSENANNGCYPPTYPPCKQLCIRYSNLFFSKQASRQTIQLKYGLNRQHQDWQRDMDFVFWFQLESALFSQLSIQTKTEEQLQRSGKIEALTYLKYYYYYLVLLGELKTKQFWADSVRYMHLHKIIKRSIHQNKQSKERISLMQAIANLAENKQKNRAQYHQNKQVLSKFAQSIREIRQESNKICQEQQQKQPNALKTKRSNKSKTG